MTKIPNKKKMRVGWTINQKKRVFIGWVVEGADLLNTEWLKLAPDCEAKIKVRITLETIPLKKGKK